MPQAQNAVRRRGTTPLPRNYREKLRATLVPPQGWDTSWRTEGLACFPRIRQTASSEGYLDGSGVFPYQQPDGPLYCRLTDPEACFGRNRADRTERYEKSQDQRIYGARNASGCQVPREQKAPENRPDCRSLQNISGARFLHRAGRCDKALAGDTKHRRWPHSVLRPWHVLPNAQESSLNLMGTCTMRRPSGGVGNGEALRTIF